MRDDDLRADLEAATKIAVEAQHSPLLGGSIGLMWTSLATVALAIHGAILADWLPVHHSMAGFVWLIYGLIGTALSVIFARRIDAKVGGNSIFNRAAQAAWCSMSLMIAAVAITIWISFVLGRVDTGAFNFIMPTAFALSTVSYGVLASLTRYGYLRYAAVASGASAVICLLMVQQNEVYFVAAILLLLSGVIPSFIEVRRETNGASAS